MDLNTESEVLADTVTVKRLEQAKENFDQCQKLQAIIKCN